VKKYVVPLVNPLAMKLVASAGKSDGLIGVADSEPSDVASNTL